MPRASAEREPVRRGELAARQRRERGDARRRILDAARELLEARSWHDVPLADVMAAAGLSRTAFYRHFEDRDQLLLALLEHAGLQLQDSGEAWKRGAGEPVAALRAGLAELTAAMVEHGRLIQAIVDASGHDPQLRAQYDELVEGIAAVTAERIRLENAAGRAAVDDPDEIATALVRMSEGYLLTAFGRAVHPDPDRVTRALADVWSATIYGREA